MFADKVKTAQAQGALAAIIYNNVRDEVPLSMTTGGDPEITIPVVGMSGVAGEKIVEQIANNRDGVSIRWDTSSSVFPNPTGMGVSTFSSIGPASNLALKPDISGPGGLIFSTFPLEKGGYATLSGTSMATPYVTGCYALLLQATRSMLSVDRKLRPLLAISILQNTARPVVSKSNPAVFESTIRQGAGLINVYDAIMTKFAVLPAKLQLGELINHSLNDSKRTARANITIVNFQKKPVTFLLSLASALSVNGQNPEIPMYDIVEGTLDAPDKVRLGANESKTIEIGISFDSDNPPDSERWVLCGYVKVGPRRGRPSYVPFAAFKGQFDAVPVLNYSPSLSSVGVPYPQLYAAITGKPFVNEKGLFTVATRAVEPVVTYTMETIFTSGLAMDFPVLRFRLEHGSPLVTVNAFNAENGKDLGLIASLAYLGRNADDAVGVEQNEWVEVEWDGLLGSPAESIGARGSGAGNSGERAGMLQKRSLESPLQAELETTNSGLQQAAQVLEEHAVEHLVNMAAPLSTLTGAPTKAPDGLYVLRIKAYAPLGNNAVFDSWYSPVFAIKRE